ncbi:MAG: hypothetical protein HY909_23645 [Deltaproteobacteria bacterium]|nr:hypothetical protein [Deltaproteobacteria bacterium]
MKELVRYLIENIQIDFQGDISLDQVRDLLRRDDSHEARLLLTKLNQDGSVEDFLLTIADVLKPYVQRNINEQALREEIIQYSEA